MVLLDLENVPITTWLTDGLTEEELQEIKEKAIKQMEDLLHLKVRPITEEDFYEIDGGNCITRNSPLCNKLHNEGVQIGDKYHLVVEETGLYCEILIEDFDQDYGTIWITYLGDNE